MFTATLGPLTVSSVVNGIDGTSTTLVPSALLRNPVTADGIATAFRFFPPFDSKRATVVLTTPDLVVLEALIVLDFAGQVTVICDRRALSEVCANLPQGLDVKATTREGLMVSLVRSSTIVLTPGLLAGGSYCMVPNDALETLTMLRMTPVQRVVMLPTDELVSERHPEWDRVADTVFTHYLTIAGEARHDDHAIA
jgi:hypothetical protein